MPEPRNKTSNHEVVTRTLREKRADFQAFVRSRVRSPEAEDVLQIAALRAVERASSLEDPARVVAWLYRLHRNVIIDVGRKRIREGQLIDATAEVPEQATQPADAACRCSVSQTNHLGSTYASILLLVDAGELKLGEAAKQLGISVNNATVRLHRARKALRERMLEHCQVSSAEDCVDCRCVYDGCCPV